ncbi:MAG: UDP-glucose 4-epimerase GalE [Johnsonella sp.]|nr:UDP-glucose 4-epimerase GalE [Johnsonella sp.]
MAILVTGGAGFIGSHTCVELLEAGYEVVVIDNLVNSSVKSLERVEEITGKKLKFYEADCIDQKALEKVFTAEKIEAVIHFAGLKAVGESVYKPLEYYHNNITGTLVLCEVMRKYGCKNIVFSSSATVYGDPAFVPITEDCPMGKITNPYGRTKGMLEQILSDLHTADEEWSVMLLRYFNPIGAHESGKIGENPKGIPNNLLPYITQVAVGKLVCLGVFGNDYDTEDGTCIRDYIHVVDLANGHLKALEKMLHEKPDVRVYNLGTGIGYSVLDVIYAFEKANDLKINYVFKERRAGDVPRCYADPKKAKLELGWTAKRGLEEMCRDSWRWQKNNPQGFEEDKTDVVIRKESGLRKQS